MFIDTCNHAAACTYPTFPSRYYDFTKPRKRTIIRRPIPFCIELMGMPGAGKTTCSELIPQFFPDCSITYHNNDSVEKEGITDKIRFNQRIAEMLRRKAAEVGTDKLVVFDRGITDERLWLLLHMQQERDTSIKALFQDLQDSLPKLPGHIRHYRFIFMQSEALSGIRRAKPRHEADRWAITDECLKHLHLLYSRLIRQLTDDKHTVIIQSDKLSLHELKSLFGSHLKKIASTELASCEQTHIRRGMRSSVIGHCQ